MQIKCKKLFLTHSFFKKVNQFVFLNKYAAEVGKTTQNCMDVNYATVAVE